MQVAQLDGWLKSVEAKLVDFIAGDETVRKLALEAMTTKQRAMVHQVAEVYGLSTTSIG